MLGRDARRPAATKTWSMRKRSAILHLRRFPNVAPELGQSVSIPAEAGFIPSYERDRQVSAPRVLVVDDERAIREILRDFLEMEGFDVTTADDGVTALHALENGRYDVLLSDLK